MRNTLAIKGEMPTVLEGVPMETIIAKGIFIINPANFPETIHEILVTGSKQPFCAIIIHDGNVFGKKPDGTITKVGKNTYLINSNDGSVEYDAEGKIVIKPHSKKSLRITSKYIEDQQDIRKIRALKPGIPKKIMRSIQEENNNQPTTVQEKIRRALRALLDCIKSI